MSDFDFDAVTRRLYDVQNTAASKIQKHPKIFGYSAATVIIIAVVIILALIIALLVYKSRAAATTSN